MCQVFVVTVNLFYFSEHLKTNYPRGKVKSEIEFLKSKLKNTLWKLPEAKLKVKTR